MNETNKSISFSDIHKLPKFDTKKIDELLYKALENFNKKIIVLDDDPTGIQTVHDIFVYTDWSINTIQNAFLEENNIFYILTNSRSFSEEKTIEVHKEIATNISHVANLLNKDYIVLSRGDSTLRGHFPLETEILKNTFEKENAIYFDGEIICPFFLEGGRYTLNNIHYVQEGDLLIPAGNTEFAKDKSFGYTSSNLGEYIEEKTNNTYKKNDCIYISLEELRSLSLSSIYEKLVSSRSFNKIIVNACCYEDIKVFTIAWIRAMNDGHHYLSRCAAALPKIIGGISSISLLKKKDVLISDTSNGGIVIIGSHVQKTTTQLNQLMNSKKDLHFIEYNVNSFYEENGLEEEVTRILQQVEALITANKSVVIYTSRTLLIPPNATKSEILAASVSISNSLTSIIYRLSIKPGFILAKGGITSSDVGTKGLSVKKAYVLGQIANGVPVWKTGPESKFPNIPYIIFPGNVGSDTTLKEIVEELI